ncbi:MAG TPA: hypothetical protein VGL04_01540 [Sporichthyaceae bacterium]
MSGTPAVVLEGEPKGSGRIVHTVLVEKLEEAEWKAKALAGIGKVPICLHFHDRDNDKTVIWKKPDGTFAVSNTVGPKPRVTVVLPQKKFYQLLKIPQGVLKLPALYTGGGLDITKLLLNRTIVVKGLFKHPIASLRVLQVLSVPPSPKK